MTSYGPVDHEAVYFMTRSRAARLPIVPPPMHNKGNHVFSLARLTRFMAERAEELGVMVLPETDAQRLLVEDGAVRGIRTGDKGRGRQGEELPTFEPGAELTAQATVLADGVQGMLSGAAIEHFGLQPENPQIYALGVKEVWRVARPLDRVVHTIGWPLKPQARYREFGGTFAYPMGPDTICLGLVVGLDYADASLSVHDLLQEVKGHPLFRRMLEGGERIAWGAKAIPEGGFWSMPASVSPPGAVILGDAAGFVNVPRLKGVHYALRSGMLAAETIHRALADGADLSQPGALSLYDAQVKNSEIYHDLRRYRNMRQAFQHGLIVGGALGGAMDTLQGDFPPWRLPTHPDSEQPVFVGKRTLRRARRQAHVRQALLGLRERQPQPRRPARPPAHPAPRAARARDRLGEPLPGAGLRGRRRGRGRPRRGRGHAVQLRPVRGDHRQGRAPDAARGRLGPRVHPDLSRARPAASGRGDLGRQPQVALDHRGRLGRGHQVALGDVDAELAQQRQLAHRLDALGRDGQAEHAPELHDHAHELALAGTRLERVDERLARA